MTKRLFISALALLGSLLLSCQKEEERIPVIKLESPIVSAEGGKQKLSVAAESDWNLSVEYQDGQTGWVSLSPASGTGFGDVFVTVSPNTGDDPRAVVVRLTTRSHQVEAPLSQNGNNAIKTPQWLELPVVDHADMFFGTHSMDGGAYKNQAQSGVRNWSFYYDYNAYVSWWVAYPMNKGLQGSGSRTDNWQATDPMLPASAVCDVTKTYGGGWTRGHQIPSQDRLDYKANVSTFYPTNMTPQDYDFNSGIWVKLETAVRNYSFKCDTLYVVTGADVRNPVQWSGDKTGHRAAVPTHYYKALLRKKGNDYSAVAFHFPHTSSIADGNYMDYAISVAALEKKVGVDFFAVLPSVVGKEKAAAIESADPKTTLENW